MTKEEQIEEIADILIECLGRETVDKFVEDEKGNLVSIQTYSLHSVAETLYNKGYRKIRMGRSKDGGYLWVEGITWEGII